TVVAEVSGPPFLVLLLQRFDIGLEREVVEAVEFGFVVEIRIHGIARRLTLGEDLEVEAVGPPLCVGIALDWVDQLAGIRRRRRLRGGVADGAAAGGRVGHCVPFTVEPRSTTRMTGWATLLKRA